MEHIDRLGRRLQISDSKMIERVRKSLFLKNFIVYSLILILSFLALGFVFTYAYREYYLRQKEELLIGQAERISEQYSLGIYTGMIDQRKITFELSVLADNMGASTILVNSRGTILFVSSDLNEDYIGKRIDVAPLLKNTEGASIATEYEFDNIFSDTALTVAYPIVAENQTIAVLVMNVSMPGLKNQLTEVYFAIFAVLAACLVVAFIAIYFFARRVTKPLIDMNEAAKVIAGGDFEKRIETDLTDEVGQLGGSFNEMAQSLSLLEKNKSLFITNLSHDIRSPLTSIKGFVTAMQDGTIPPENYGKYLKIVQDESDRIIKLTNEMIDLNSFDDGSIRMNYSEFDLNELIRKCAEKAETEVRMKNLEFEVVFAEEKTVVKADYDKVEKILGNLLDNAQKFTDKGGIKVETELSGRKVLVFVKDSGIGMTEEQQKKAFDRFYKADDSRGEDKTGSGLGLSIVKEFVKAHDGSITLKSNLNEGTEFCFSLSRV